MRNADAELAEVIDTLPDHLQPDYSNSEDLRQLELGHPWVKWQRFDISIILLHFRIRITRILQSHWRQFPDKYNWARVVSISSARSVIWINRNWDQPASMRKQWYVYVVMYTQNNCHKLTRSRALAHHIFTSAALLIQESRGASAETAEFDEAIQAGLELLDQVKYQNSVAFYACQILREAWKRID